MLDPHMQQEEQDALLCGTQFVSCWTDGVVGYGTFIILNLEADLEVVALRKYEVGWRIVITKDIFGLEVSQLGTI